MLCCVSKKSSTRSNVRNNKKVLKPMDYNGSESSSGFSESSSVSSGDFASSGFSAASSSSSSSNTSGFSSVGPRSLGDFVGSGSDSGTSGFEFSNRFDMSDDYLENSSNLEPAAFDTSSSSFSSFAKGSSRAVGDDAADAAVARRMETFLPLANSSTNRSKDVDGQLIVEREKSNEDEPPVLLPCAICTRTFMPQSLEKHRRICERSAVKKRKPFDSAKQRIQGTDLAEFLPKETVKKKVYQDEKPVAAATIKGTWKQTHDEFIRAIQAAREETIDVAPQRQTVAPNPVIVGVPTRPNEKGMCPTCNRQFSIKSYERHVAWCKERVTRVPINTASNVAKERLEARMRYRAPLLKNRRITNREKYAPGSAMNLPSTANKNSTLNSRANESASMPNCNNKDENGSTTGCQKTTANSRRSSHGQEGVSSGPMKSRLSDRSSRSSADVETAPTTNLSSSPIPPFINEHQRLQLSSKRAIPPIDNESPLPTHRSVGEPGTSRSSSRDNESFRKIHRDGCRAKHDRRSIDLNIFDASKHCRKENIVSARSRGHPKVNDVSINDELVGMTVQSCGIRDNEKREKGLVTWKQIREDKFTERSKFLNLNDEKNVERSRSNLTITESDLLVRKKSLRGAKSGTDLDISATSGIKNLNQTYLIRESLDAEKSLSEMLGGRMHRPVVSSPKSEFHCAAETRRKNIFDDSMSDEMVSDGFDGAIRVTSSPIASRERDSEGCEKNSMKAVSSRFSEQLTLVPLNLEIMHNDEISDREDTSRSAGSTVSSLQTCRRSILIRSPKLTPIIGHASLNLKTLGEQNFTSLENCDDYSEGSGEIAPNINRRNDNQLIDSWRSAGNSKIGRVRCNRLAVENMLKTNSIQGEKFDAKAELSLNCENPGSKNQDEIIGDNGRKSSMEDVNRTLEISRSSELTQKIETQLNSNEQLDVSFYDKNYSQVDCLSENIHHDDLKTIVDEKNPTSENSRSFQSTETATSIYNEPLEEKMSGMKFSVGGVPNCDMKCSGSLNMDNSLIRINSCHSVRDMRHRTDFDDSFVTLYSPRYSRSAAGAIESRSSFGRLINLVDEPKVACYELSHDSNCSEENDGVPIDPKSREVEVTENGAIDTVENNCVDNNCVENQSNNCVDIVLESPSKNIERSPMKPVETEEDCSISESTTIPVIEQPRNYRRCETYVIDRVPNFDSNPIIPVSDESPEEKPLLKRRRTDQESTIGRMKNVSIFNEDRQANDHLQNLQNRQANDHRQNLQNRQANDHLQNLQNRQANDHLQNLQNRQADDHLQNLQNRQANDHLQNLQNRQANDHPQHLQNRQADDHLQNLQNRQANDHLQNLQKRHSDHRMESAKKLERRKSEVESTDQKVDDIHEKWINRNFDYDSDIADSNLSKDTNAEVLTTNAKSFNRHDTSSYDLHPKAFSDSIVLRQTSLPIVPETFEKQSVAEVSSEIRKKLKKKINLLRGSTDTLITSVEACDKIIHENSTIIPKTPKIEKIPQVEKQTIRKIDFETMGKFSTTNTSCHSFLPEISVDCAAAKIHDENEGNLVTHDGNCLWMKARDKLSPKLINLDPPKCRETRVKNTRQANVGNLPPVVPASIRKIRRRSSYRDPRASWSNYVRRHPDFDLVLTGRTGSSNDYDPFVLAERQMRELMQDTCSDQSFQDYSNNVCGSSSTPNPNYPLSHSSAFVKYPDPVTRNLNNLNNRVSLIAPPSEFDDLAAGFSSDSTETNSISREILTDLEDSRSRDNLQNRDNNKNKDSRDHILGRRVIIDKSKALGTNTTHSNLGEKNSQTNEKARKIFDKVGTKIVRPQVTRSNSVRANSALKAPERKNNNCAMKEGNKVNSRSCSGPGLTGKNNNSSSLSGSNVSLSSIVSSEVEVKRSNSLFDDIASSFEDDAPCNYPSLRSLLKNDSLSVSSPVQSNRTRNGMISDEELSSPDSYQRQDHSKLSADSAYSSLNRKYSNHGRSTNEVGGRQEDDTPQRRRDVDVGSTSSAKSKLSKFCHECGCKFPETAKYCCECGIRRLTL